MADTYLDPEAFMYDDPNEFLCYCARERMTPKIKGEHISTHQSIDQLCAILAQAPSAYSPDGAGKQRCIDKLKQLTVMVLNEVPTIIVADSSKGKYVQPQRDGGPSHELLHVEPAKMILKRHGSLVSASYKFHRFSGGEGRYRVHFQPELFPEEVVVTNSASMDRIARLLDDEMKESLRQIAYFTKLLRP